MGIAQAERARAALMPSVDATATARYSRITQSIGLPTDGDWHWLMAGLVNLNYDLDLWGKNRASLRAAVSERAARSEEHTSELQSLMRTSYAVFCLNKKKPQ